MNAVPQPSIDRMTPFDGHPIVVGVVPGQPSLVAVTAASWATALRVPAYFAYADPTRVVEREEPDGSVLHAGLDPDVSDDDEWRDRQAHLKAGLAEALAGTQLAWKFRYLAGRPDRALTHLARAVDACALVVGAGGHRLGAGSHGPGGHGFGARMHELLEGTVAAHLAHHQHRPVLVVPLSVVDWKEPIPWR